ncbi:hypothetical protein PRIO_0875 [Paenibacillus riograndensis SBR5]|uniref:Uncharacterized protein n=1 Tax=Paenibacillus riograndensis SBR5 TaxID=1073571 RepID=A0A0E4H6V3_9BACL|nr:hypothetical protein PRIO_0875 [Paenibacillus riograndensis SBR5]
MNTKSTSKVRTLLGELGGKEQDGAEERGD